MTSTTLRIRPARFDDARRLFEWSNDPATRAASFETAPIAWESHLAWLEKRLADPSCRIWLAESEGGDAVGVVRFELEDGAAAVSVTVAPEHRARGRAAALLDVAVRALFEATEAPCVRALIRPENEASRRAFERAGFAPAPSPRADAVCLVRGR